MQRSIHAATVQMDVRPAPTNERLYRADQLICDAVELGTELIVLPELFNTGYAYTDENFQRAEKSDGATLTWMKRTARRFGVYLAGSLLLMEDGEIYNAMFIVAPDGQSWRYDKSYPWAWERGYFRENPRKGAQRAVVAHTGLGDLGMLVCWDVAHPDLWEAYAGQVDLMLVCSCPPEMTNPTFSLPHNIQLTADQMGLSSVKDEGCRIFGQMVEEQSAWLGVPVVHSAACGAFESPVPNGRATLLGLIPKAPGLALHLMHADQMQVTAPMIEAGQMLAANGTVLARGSQARGESFAHAEIPLPAQKNAPQAPQPPSQASQTSYFFSDTYLPKIMLSTYQSGLKRHHSI